MDREMAAFWITDLIKRTERNIDKKTTDPRSIQMLLALHEAKDALTDPFFHIEADLREGKITPNQARKRMGFPPIESLNAEELHTDNEVVREKPPQAN